MYQLFLEWALYHLHFLRLNKVWGKRGRKQTDLPYCLFNIKAFARLGSLDLSNWKPLCKGVSNSVSQNTVELAHLSSTPLHCSRKGMSSVLTVCSGYVLIYP